jgi:precorrin-2 methylase
MAFQDLAARASTVLLAGAERLSLVTALDGPEALDPALDDPTAAVVVYKGGRHLPGIARRLAAAGRLEGAVVGELLGLPGQRVAPAADVADAPATYLATVIVPPAANGAAR